MKLPFTDKSLATLELPPDKPQIVAWDTKQVGLGFVLGRGGGSFVFRFRRDGKRIQEVLGHRSEMTLPAARAAARAIAGRVVEGRPTPKDVRDLASSGPTLAEATAGYLASMTNGGCRPTSITSVQREIPGYLGAWLERPLRSITARECRERHATISEDNGKHVANRVMRELRSLWNHVAREAIVDDSTWPPNPTIAVNWHQGDQPGYTDRRREPIPWSRLSAWRRAVDELSAVRRDYQIVVLLTGLRRTDACTLRSEHVNTEDNDMRSRVWHVGKQTWEEVVIPPAAMIRPSPKGGAKRAFIVPLSSVLVEVLRRRRAENQELGADDRGWMFPSRALKTQACWACAELGLDGHQARVVTHIAEPKERDDEIPSPHRLRDTYITAAEEVGVPDGVVKVLVNHAWGRGNVTAGYRRQDLGLLREGQEKTSAFLIARMITADA